ncbi:hypothetical protein [Pseudoxanthomonas putridarboris]|uniref:Uncharacterized protein n=1 Tax=Pseudoxanthomonas putridarboris TaxID=752605 RepID=A0ABU9J0Y5_9GAMM
MAIAAGLRRIVCVAVCLCATFGVQAAELAGLRILPRSDAGHSFPGWQSEGALPSSSTVPLELGDEIHGATLQLQPSRPGGQYRVRVQYETSMGLSAEGPHLDLVDWKHCVSDWQPAEASDALSFVLPEPTEEQSSCFPPYAPAELEQAVRDLGRSMGDPAMAEAWLDDLRTPSSVIGVSPFVAISKVRVRVEVLRDGKWADVATVAFMPAMGC